MRTMMSYFIQRRDKRALLCFLVLVSVGTGFFSFATEGLAQTGRPTRDEAELEAQGRLNPEEAELEAQRPLNPEEAELEAQQARPGGPEFAEEQPQPTPPGLTVPVGDPSASPAPSPAPASNPSPAESNRNSEGEVAPGGLVASCEGTSCSACDLAELANNVIKWLIGIMFLLFAVITVVAGFGLVTSGGNSGALQDAKKKLTNGIIGIIIVMAAWLLVDTMMRGLLGDNGEIKGYGPWSEIECATQVETVIDENFYDEVVYPFVESGGEHGAPSDSGPVTGSGSNCPAAPEDSVVTIPGTSFKAKPNISANFVKMREAAARDGITLRVTSGWRSEATQVRLFNQFCPGGTCGATKAARPCSLGGGGSNHNSGEAVDISVGCRNGQSNCNTNVFNWLKANGAQYGFRNNLPTDPVHWSPSGR